MKTLLLASTIVALSSYANATITFFDDKNVPQPSEQNIQFEASNLVPQLIHTGDTNKTMSPVVFTTVFAKGTGSLGGNGTGQLFEADGIGQGSLICADTAAKCPSAAGGLTNLLTSMDMHPGTGLGWTDAIINLQNGITAGTSQVNIWVKDDLGNNFDDALKKGENFLTIVASGGEVISDIQVSQMAGTTGEFGWEKFKQPRVSGVCTLVGSTCTPIPVPEPIALAVLGVGLVGLAFAKRRTRSSNGEETSL